MRRILILVTIVMSITSTRAALAWNDTGHMTVALIAYRQLSDGHRNQIAELLKQHPHYELYLTAGRDEGVSAEEWAFLRAAVWPDLIRPARPGSPEEKYKGPQITKYHNAEWHYVTIPWVPPAERGLINPTTLPSRTEPNVFTALDQHTRTLADRNAPAAERAVALAWIEHCVGDMHQPLHACTMFTSQYPTGDRGGNTICVRASGTVLRVHTIWDEALGSSDAYLAIDFLAKQIVNDPMLAESRLTELEQRSFDVWAMESHRWAVAMAHLNGRLRSATWDLWQAQQITAEDVPNLPPSYLANVRDLSKRRVALAGRRLAQTIAKSLDESK